jgi:hypothetical protein
MPKVQVRTSGIDAQFDAKGAIALLNAIAQVISFAIWKDFDNTTL